MLTNGYHRRVDDIRSRMVERIAQFGYFELHVPVSNHTFPPGKAIAYWTFSWVYLFFFNTLWVWIPLWILYEAYKHITTALNQQQAQTEIKKNA